MLGQVNPHYTDERILSRVEQMLDGMEERILLADIKSSAAHTQQSTQKLPSSSSSAYSSSLASLAEQGQLPSSLLSSPRRRDTRRSLGHSSRHTHTSSSFTDTAKKHTADAAELDSEADLLSTASSDSGESTQDFILHHPNTHAPYSPASPVLLSSVDLSHPIVGAYAHTGFAFTYTEKLS